MQLRALGGFTLRLTTGEHSVLYNPPREGGKRGRQMSADVVIVSLRDECCDGVATVAPAATSPFIVDSPGSYEYRDIRIEGWGAPTTYQRAPDRHTRIATITLLEAEEVRVLCVVGLSDPTLPPECQEHLETVDVLIVPIGIDGMLTAEEAHSLVTRVEPAVVVPVGWQGTPGGEEALEHFLKECGSEAKPLSRVSFRARDLKEKTAEVVVLAA